MRLDYKSKFPEDMEDYLEFNGWHFNKKMCEWATSNMYKIKDGKRIKHKDISKEQFEELVKKCFLPEHIDFDKINDLLIETRKAIYF